MTNNALKQCPFCSSAVEPVYDEWMKPSIGGKYVCIRHR